VPTSNTGYLRTWNTPIVPLFLRRGEKPLPPLLPQLAGPLSVLLSNLPAGVPSLVPRISSRGGVRRLPVLLGYSAP
jgi:hypothetical protein